MNDLSKDADFLRARDHSNFWQTYNWTPHAKVTLFTHEIWDTKRATSFSFSWKYVKQVTSENFNLLLFPFLLDSNKKKTQLDAHLAPTNHFFPLVLKYFRHTKIWVFNLFCKIPSMSQQLTTQLVVNYAKASRSMRIFFFKICL